MSINTFSLCVLLFKSFAVSILAGVTSWSTKHDYLNVKFNQIFDKIQDNSSNSLATLPLSDDSGKDTYLFTRCLQRNDSGSIQYGNANALKLYDNEQLSIFTPSYHDSKIYTNYIYYKYIGNRTFKANNIYKLLQRHKRYKLIKLYL